jgi:hypothetical protein
VLKGLTAELYFFTLKGLLWKNGRFSNYWAGKDVNGKRV